MKKKLGVTVLTLFPDFIDHYKDFGIIKKAMKSGLLKLEAVNLRKFSPDRRGTVDDRPYGGGVGMVLRPDVLHKAITKLKAKNKKAKVILLTPQGKKFSQNLARKLSASENLILVCGRYEGFDERVREFVDEEISIGDYVLMGGELPALVVTEAVARLIPGIVGKIESTENESFSTSLLEYPQYTKPGVLEIRNQKLGIRKLRVPKVLLTGNHAAISKWRNDEAHKRTKKRRPDLLK